MSSSSFLTEQLDLCHDYALPEGFFWMPLSVIIMAYLMASTPSKWWYSWGWGKEKNDTEQDHVNRVVVSIWYFSQPATQHNQSCYFSDMPKSSVIIFQILFLFMFNRLAIIQQVSQMIATYQLPYSLDNDFSPAGWRPPASRVIFHLLAPLFEPVVLLKNMCVQHAVIIIHLLKHFKCLWGSFPQWNQKFQVYSYLNVHSCMT